jgi:hypothetical protein
MDSWNGNFRYIHNPASYCETYQGAKTICRYQWDAHINSQELVEYYMPPFQSCARDSNVGAFMCSYNALNGVPTCADPWLLNDVLREHWGWTNEQQWVTYGSPINYDEAYGSTDHYFQIGLRCSSEHLHAPRLH